MEATKVAVELTEAELRVIEIRRKEEALAKEKAAAELEIKVVGLIEHARKQMELAIAEAAKQNAAAIAFWDNCPVDARVDWEMAEKTTDQKFEAYYYGDKDESGGRQKIVVKEFPCTTKTIFFQHKTNTSAERIYVNHHKVYSGSFSMTVQNKGYELCTRVDFKDQWYKKLTSAIKRINATIETAKAKRKAEAAKQSLDILAEQKVKALYPEAEVIKDQQFHRRYNSSREGYYTYHIKATFPNSLVVWFSYGLKNEEVSISPLSIHTGSLGMAAIDALKTLPKV